MSSDNANQNHYFPSKRDTWIVALIWGSVLISLIGGIVPLVISGISGPENGFVVVLITAMDGLMLWVLYGTGYWVTRDELLTRCGPFSFRIRMADIESIVPTMSVLSSPACSIDRLKIVYGLSQQNLMVSPSDQAGFLSAIVQKCPTLVVLHDRVRKKASSTFEGAEPII